jgi:hypothetical protein
VSTRKFEVAMAHLKYYPNNSEGNEGNHKESVKTARDQTEKGVSDFHNTWLE